MSNLTRVVITGADGLLGQHAKALFHALNSAAAFKGEKAQYEVRAVNRSAFANIETLTALLDGADVVMHFAGMNRATDSELKTGNQQIASQLVDCLERSGSAPHVIYANSTHSTGDTLYGTGKREAGELFDQWAANASAKHSNVLLPHIFGEGGKPFYNSAAATLCYQIVNNEEPSVNADGAVELLHASDVSELFLQLYNDRHSGIITPPGRKISIPDLHSKLQLQHSSYVEGLIPELTDRFDVQLFNVLRTNMFPKGYPHKLKINKDERGELFEAVKGGQGQTFLSWTVPGVTRGDHFHRNKVERFLVVKGQATIRVRHIFSDEVHEFPVNGDEPAYVDMPTFHTHSIKNTGDTPLLTLFWANEIFDPNNPDTYATKVLSSDE